MKYPTTDRPLLNRVRRGDEVSWRDFYERYSPVIRGVGALYRFSAAEQEDLVQLVMMKFFAHARDYVYLESRAKFRTYLASIIRSTAVDFIRSDSSRRRAEARAAEYDVGTGAFEEEFMNEWRRVILKDALGELRRRVTFRTYQAFQLYGIQNRPAEEVAALLEISVHQVHVAKSRCKKTLREILAERNAGDEELNINV